MPTTPLTHHYTSIEIDNWNRSIAINAVQEARRMLFRGDKPWLVSDGTAMSLIQKALSSLAPMAEVLPDHEGILVNELQSARPAIDSALAALEEDFVARVEASVEPDPLTEAIASIKRKTAISR